MSKMQSIEKLFYRNFFITLVIELCCIGGLVFIICSANDCIETFGEYWIVAYVLLILVFAGASILVFSKLIPSLKDFGDLKNKNYAVISGKVLSIKKDPEANDNQHICLLKVMTLDSEIVTFTVDEELEKNKTYRFLYLKNTKIAMAKK